MTCWRPPEQADNHADEEREERRDDEVDDVRHERLEPFLELRAEDAEDESRQDRALIADDRDGETEDVHHHRLLCAARDGCPSVRELRSDEHEAEDDADDRRAAEALHRRPADERRQEDERRIRQNLAHRQDVLAELKAERLACAAQAHEKTGGNEDRDDRDEDVAERAGNLLHRRHLRVSLFFVAHAREIRALDELVKDLVDEARAEDDLVLGCCKELALDAVDVLDGLLINLRLVVDDEAQARRAVLSVADIVLAADVLPDELCHALLVREIVVLVVFGWCSGLCRCSFFCGRFRRDRLVAKRDRDVAELCRIRHNDRRRRLIASGLDGLRVELEEQLAFLDRIALRCFRREMLAFELHRIHADMDEDFDAVRRLHADGMLRFEEHRDFAVERCVDLAFRVLDGRAAPHRTAAEHRVLDVAERNELAFERAVQTNVFHFVPSICKRTFLLMIP